MKHWLRKVRVTMTGGGGGLVLNPADYVTEAELRIAFSVSKTITGTPNEFSLQIWNMKPGHRAAVGKELDLISVEAGYIPPGGGGAVGLIAKGRVRDVEHRREGPDIVTHVSCGDGDKASRKATISVTLDAGASVEEAVEAIYAEMEKQGIDRGEWKFPDDAGTFRRPYSMCGACTRELDTLGRGAGFYWSMQDEVLEIIPRDGAIQGGVLISPNTGMIGAPAVTDNGVKVSALLNPGLQVNRTVVIQSEVLEMNRKGSVYRIGALDFSGDNQEGDFTVAIHGETVNGDKVDEGAAAE